VDPPEGKRYDAGESLTPIVVLLIQAGVLLLAGAAVLFLSEYRYLPWLLLGAGMLSLLTLVVFAVATARDTDLRWGQVVVWVQLGVDLVLVLYLGAAAIYQAARVGSLGPGEDQWWIFFGILLTGLVLISCGRLLLLRRAESIAPKPRRAIAWSGIGLVGLMAFAGLASATIQSRPVACSLFSLDGETWADASGREAQRIGDSLIRCDSLTGRSAAEVSEMFGIEGRVETLHLGTVNSFIGPGDAQFLTIAYDRGGRVRSARLSSPPSD
jgi:hypothetical protein